MKDSEYVEGIQMAMHIKNCKECDDLLQNTMQKVRAHYYVSIGAEKI